MHQDGECRVIRTTDNMWKVQKQVSGKQKRSRLRDQQLSKLEQTMLMGKLK